MNTYKPRNKLHLVLRGNFSSRHESLLVHLELRISVLLMLVNECWIIEMSSLQGFAKVANGSFLSNAIL